LHHPQILGTPVPKSDNVRALMALGFHFSEKISGKSGICYFISVVSPVYNAETWVQQYIHHGFKRSYRLDSKTMKLS
jgi:hypothetical protein